MSTSLLFWGAPNWAQHSRSGLTSAEEKDCLLEPSGNAYGSPGAHSPSLRHRHTAVSVQPGAHQNPSCASRKLLSSWVCPGRHWDLLKNRSLLWWPHTMPLSFVDCSKGSRSYPLSNCDLSIWYLPIITWIPSTKSFLYTRAKIIKRKKTSALMSLKTAPLLKISH